MIKTIFIHGNQGTGKNLRADAACTGQKEISFDFTGMNFPGILKKITPKDYDAVIIQGVSNKQKAVIDFINNRPKDIMVIVITEDQFNSYKGLKGQFATIECLGLTSSLTGWYRKGCP